VADITLVQGRPPINQPPHRLHMAPLTGKHQRRSTLLGEQARVLRQPLHLSQVPHQAACARAMELDPVHKTSEVQLLLRDVPVVKAVRSLRSYILSEAVQSVATAPAAHLMKTMVPLQQRWAYRSVEAPGGNQVRCRCRGGGPVDYQILGLAETIAECKRMFWHDCRRPLKLLLSYIA
jgi:hypothetical protein